MMLEYKNGALRTRSVVSQSNPGLPREKPYDLNPDKTVTTTLHPE